MDWNTVETQPPEHKHLLLKHRQWGVSTGLYTDGVGYMFLHNFTMLRTMDRHITHWKLIDTTPPEESNA